MSKTTITLNRTSGTSKLVRARFGPGMLLQHEDLEQLNTYTRDLSRLLFRSFFGCGVVCGLRVTPDEKCGKLLITIGAGLALDCKGDPVHLPNNQSITIGDECEDDSPELQELWVGLCGTTKSCAPRTAMCASEDDEQASSYTRESDGYEIRVMSQRPECACGCEMREVTAAVNETACKCVDPKLACYADHYAGKCGCACNECSDCTCILLARLYRKGKGDSWLSDSSVRRFIRPVLMRDPAQDEKPTADPRDQTSNAVVPAEHALAHPAAAQTLEPRQQPSDAMAELHMKLASVQAGMNELIQLFGDIKARPAEEHPELSSAFRETAAPAERQDPNGNDDDVVVNQGEANAKRSQESDSASPDSAATKPAGKKPGKKASPDKKNS